MIGNGLRELDRFLTLMIDAIATEVTPDAGLARLRNTPNKLRSVRAAMALPCPDETRLRAIGRSRDCLFHCAGIVRRGDRRSDDRMTAGWRLRGRVALGDRLPMTRADLASVCRFYDRIADDLRRAFDNHAGNIAFSAAPAYIGGANVACERT